MTPRVSVIMAAHNHAHFLPRSIGSVKAQTYPDYEFIVVDNGSTDETRNVIDALKWEKLQYIYQDDTGSVSGPRNTGLKFANGDYVAFLDSDDNWTPDKLDACMRVLDQDPAIDVLCHDMIRRTSTKILNRINVGTGRSASIQDALLFDGNFLLGSATIVKRTAMAAVGGFDPRPEFVHAEDYEAWLRLAEHGNRFYFLNAVLGDLYVHESNLSGDVRRACDDLRNVIRHHYAQRYPHPALFQMIRFQRAMANTYYMEARNWQQKQQRGNAIRYYLRTIFTYPFLLKPYLFLVLAIFRLEFILEKLKIYTIRV